MKTEQEIRKFVMEWLWASSKRRTVNREWDQQYIGDMVDMIQEAQAELAKQYNELIYAVARKFEGETRHQTALRYINEAERSCVGIGAQVSTQAEKGQKK